MPTLKEIIYNFKNLRAKGNQSDDIKLSDAQVMFIVDQYRAKLIKQDIDRGKPYNPKVVQDLGFIPIKPAGTSLMVGPVSGLDMYVTEVDLPSMIETNRVNFWTFVGPNPVSLPYQRTTVTKIAWDKHSKYTSHLPKWFELENRLYVYYKRKEATEDTPEEKIPTEVFAMGIAESPYAVLSFKNEIDFEDPYNFEYPISVTMLDSLYKLIADLEYKILHMALNDTSNDGNEAAPKQ